MNQTAARPRVLVTKIGLDGHDRGSRVVASYLRDAGMEVVYTPPWQSVEAVVRLCEQEDIDVIGVSSLATDHLLIPDLMRALGDAGLGDVEVVVGGIVPRGERPMLEASGVGRIYGPGASREDIVAGVSELADRARVSKAEVLSYG